MTPDQLKALLRGEYEELLRRGVRNPDVLIEARCREAAAHNGVPEYWRNYMPAMGGGKQ